MIEIINFFNNPFFIIVGAFSTIFMMASFIYVAYLVIKGVLPVWYRLGIGLSARKVAIFADIEYESLKSMLVDSGMFKEENIFQVHNNALKKAESESLFLVHWKDYQDKINEILTIKKDSAALIIHAPQNEGRIDDQSLSEINSHRNSIIVNFRGRLMNDILTSMITTSYEQK
jgi:hypothetical protein